MTDYADLEKRLRDTDDLVTQARGDDDLADQAVEEMEERCHEAADALASLTKERDEARAAKAAWNEAITELAQMPGCTAEAIDKMRCLYTFIFDAVPEFTFEEEISDIVVRYPMKGQSRSFSFHFAKGMRAFPIWSDPYAPTNVLSSPHAHKDSNVSPASEGKTDE